jgi:hypothetical protein
MKRITFVALLMLVALLSFTDEWYSIDGFYLLTPDGIRIEEAPGTGGRRIDFFFPGESAPGARGLLVQATDRLAPTDAALVGLFELLRGATPPEGNSIVGMRNTPGPQRGGGETRIVMLGIGTVEDTELWPGWVVELGQTPGGLYTHLVVLPYAPGQEGENYLEALLESLEVEIAEAAG